MPAVFFNTRKYSLLPTLKNCRPMGKYIKAISKRNFIALKKRQSYLPLFYGRYQP